MNRSKGKERRIGYYSSSQKMLLVGEGDFSFSACLARAFHTGENMVATSYITRGELPFVHSTSTQHLDDLDNLGCLLLHNVDVYTMHTHPTLNHMKFDVIIFNFPHAGHYEGLCERDPELIEMHKELVEAYFNSASKMLTKGGEVHVTHIEGPLYDSWNIVLLASKAGLTLKRKLLFLKRHYPGYHNKRGVGVNSNKTFPFGRASTFKFVLQEVVDHHNHLSDKDEKNNDQVLDDKIQVLSGEDTVYNHANVSVITEEDHVNSNFQKDEVDDDPNLLENDEANELLLVQKNDEVDVDSKLESSGSSRLKTEHMTWSNSSCKFCFPTDWLLTWFESWKE